MPKRLSKAFIIHIIVVECHEKSPGCGEEAALPYAGPPPEELAHAGPLIIPTSYNKHCLKQEVCWDKSDSKPLNHSIHSYLELD